MSFWPMSTAQLIASIAILLGIVVLMGGRGGVRTAEQIGFVVLGFIVLALLFGLVVSRAL
jgi:hypothetical protein